MTQLTRAWKESFSTRTSAGRHGVGSGAPGVTETERPSRREGWKRQGPCKAHASGRCGSRRRGSGKAERLRGVAQAGGHPAGLLAEVPARCIHDASCGTMRQTARRFPAPKITGRWRNPARGALASARSSRHTKRVRPRTGGPGPGQAGRTLPAAEKIEFGMVGFNTGAISNAAAPFGGMKQSGLAAKAVARAPVSSGHGRPFCL